MLRLEGFEAESAATARMGIQLFQNVHPDLVVLDHFLPDLTGAEVCKRLRQQSSVPIMMLTSDAQEGSIVSLLEGGADDYITKPFRPREFLARVRALLRRAGLASLENEEQIFADPLVIDLKTRQVRWQDSTIALTPTEFRLIHYLAANAGRVLTFDQLVQHLWGYEGAGNEELVRVHISRLRKKLRVIPEGESLLNSHPRVGYSFKPLASPRSRRD